MVFLLNEVQNVEAFQGPAREEAVHGVLFIIEEFKYVGQSGQKEYFQMRPVEVHQPSLPPTFRSLASPPTYPAQCCQFG